MTETRDHAHELIDLLPEPQLSGLVHLLSSRRACLAAS